MPWSQVSIRLSFCNQGRWLTKKLLSDLNSIVCFSMKGKNTWHFYEDGGYDNLAMKISKKCDYSRSQSSVTCHA